MNRPLLCTLFFAVLGSAIPALAQDAPDTGFDDIPIVRDEAARDAAAGVRDSFMAVETGLRVWAATFDELAQTDADARTLVEQVTRFTAVGEALYDALDDGRQSAAELERHVLEQTQLVETQLVEMERRRARCAADVERLGAQTRAAQIDAVQRVRNGTLDPDSVEGVRTLGALDRAALAAESAADCVVRHDEQLGEDGAIGSHLIGLRRGHIDVATMDERLRTLQAQIVYLADAASIESDARMMALVLEAELATLESDIAELDALLVDSPVLSDFEFEAQQLEELLGTELRQREPLTWDDLMQLDLDASAPVDALDL